MPDEALSPTWLGCLGASQRVSIPARSACRGHRGMKRWLEMGEACPKCLAWEMAQRTYKMSADLKSGGLENLRRQSGRVKVVDRNIGFSRAVDLWVSVQLTVECSMMTRSRWNETMPKKSISGRGLRQVWQCIRKMVRLISCA